MYKATTMQKRAVFAAVVGSVLEWYDFLIYGTLVGLVLNKLFFPASNPLVSNLMAWASVAVASVSKPLGAMIFGHFGDKYGRKTIMSVTLFVMGFSTLLLGCMPTYAKIGIWAPIGLVILRLIQGFALGGEWGGAVLLTFEYATPKTRCFYSSLMQLGISGGMFMASGVTLLVTTTMSSAAFMAWGWRLPMILSIVLAFVGLYVRQSIMETPDFQNAAKEREQQERNKVPVLMVLTHFKKRLAAGVIARGAGAVNFNVLCVFMIAYLTQYMNVPKTNALLAVNIGTVVMVVMVPLAGYLGDKFGCMTIYRLGNLLEGLCAFPLFYLIRSSSGNVFIACAGLFLYLGLVHGTVAGLNPSMCSRLFPVQVRYTGVALTYEMANLSFAAFTPMIAVFLLHLNDNKPWLLCTYMLCVGIASVLASSWIKSYQDTEEQKAHLSEEMQGVANVR
jgi:MFS family permease